MKNLVLLLLLFISLPALSQDDSTQALFKNVRYSYAQCDLGYSAVPFKDQFMNGFGMRFGAAFNKKIYFGIGVANHWLSNVPAPTYPQSSTSTLSLTYTSFDIEYLYHPNKLFNFSIPLSAALSTVQYTNVVVTGSGPFNDKAAYISNFFTARAGLNLFVNLVKQVSLGVGGGYRFAMNVGNGSSDADFSGYSVQALLRFKLYTREWYEQQLKRQQELLKNNN